MPFDLTKPENQRDPYATEREGSESQLTRQYPEVSGFLQALLGAAPDEVGGSVLDPNRERLQAGAKYGFPLGTLAAVAPALGPLSKVAATGVRAGARNLAVPSQLSRQAGVIKAPGGNWLSGSVEGALGGLKRPEMGNYNPPGNWVPDAPTESLNKWVDTQLTRYVKNEMATPQDPIRALAERGVSHAYTPDDALHGAWEAESLGPMRHAAGFPAEGMAKSDMAKAWELASDQSLDPRTAGEMLQGANRSPRWESAAQVEQHLARDPWLAKVPPETPTYSVGPQNTADELGFNHLIDELRNASDPASGLPRELLIKPESMARMSVPQAVERVAKINEWRAAQKVAADQARAQNPATVLHKEYPDKGFKWVELKMPEAKLPEGYQFKKTEDGVEIIDPEGRVRNRARTEAEAFANWEGRSSLEDALKYEGDTMGHCVGGYCPDVEEGRSRIFSLRSAKGEPHVTIETNPTWMTQDAAARMARSEGLKGFDFASRVSDLMEGKGAPPSIRQIKGKANRAPNEEYLPYVQDFVKSGQWSDVGDARNAGLRKFTDVFNNNELRALQEAGAELPNSGWLTGEDIQGLHNMITPEGKRLQYDASGNIVGGYARGGTVRSAVPLFAMGGAVDAIMPDMQDGGQVYNDPSTPQAGQPMRNGGPVTLDMMRLALQQRK